MAKEKVKTTLDKYEIQSLARKYKDKSYGFFSRCKLFGQIAFTIFFTALSYGAGWCIFKFGNWMEWWGDIWYLPVIFSAITLVVCLCVLITSTLAKRKILNQIPQEDKAYFFSLVGIEYKNEDKFRQEQFEKSLKVTAVRPSEYELERANEKERALRNKEIKETIDKISDALESSKTESYDIYDVKGNHIGRADKK